METQDILEHKVQEQHEKFLLLIGEYQAKDICNCNETGLFYSALLTKYFPKRGSECHRGKNLKEHVTVFLCVNLESSLEKMLAIEKLKKL